MSCEDFMQCDNLWKSFFSLQARGNSLALHFQLDLSWDNLKNSFQKGHIELCMLSEKKFVLWNI